MIWEQSPPELVKKTNNATACTYSQDTARWSWEDCKSIKNGSEADYDDSQALEFEGLRLIPHSFNLLLIPATLLSLWH